MKAGVALNQFRYIGRSPVPTGIALKRETKRCDPQSPRRSAGFWKPHFGVILGIIPWLCWDPLFGYVLIISTEIESTVVRFVTGTSLSLYTSGFVLP